MYIIIAVYCSVTRYITHLYVEGNAPRYLEAEALLLINLQCKQDRRYDGQYTCKYLNLI